jgi:hypothetical protein
MSTFLDGQQNLAALAVPGVYVDIIPPSPNLIGVPTNMVGLVGVGSWGPLNAPIPVSKPNDAAVKIGTPIIRSYDLATHVWAASQVGGAVGFYCVRVSDATDVAASVVVQTNCITFTAKYTGILGNSIIVNLAAGTASGSKMATVSFPGAAPETFNNITGTGNAFWLNLAAAINSGNATRGASNYIVAAAGVGTTAPTLATPVTLSGGTDGASGVTAATLMGVDTTPRTGMYALRNSNVSAFTLVDMTDGTKLAAIDVFAVSENAYAVHATVSGDTIASAVAARVTAGLDSFASKLIVGDWPTFYDSQNGLARLVNPTAFSLGMIGNLSPEQTPLNKPLRGVIATQKSQTGQTYSDAELSIAELGGVDLIVGAPTTPGGNYFTFITGRNTSSNTAGNGDEYSRMTFFLASSAQSKAAGSFVGRLQSIRPTDKTRLDAKALFDGFSAQLADPASGSQGNGMIDAWSTQCDLNNNTPNLQARGFLFLYWSVRYLNVVRYFVVKLAGGGNVSVTVQSDLPSAAQFQ